ncbi:MAG: protein disulfide oxidoreductase [Gammaproteobacteria bacterium]|nr:protein disulfide oxidoreductase [Gammaproteobacteria bacterium]
MKKSRFNWKSWLINISIVLVAYWAIQLYQGQDAPSGAAPLLSGISLDGKPVDLRQMRDKPVLVHFWATWCGVCRLEYASIDKLASEYQVITIATQSGSRSQVREHVKRVGITAPVLVDDLGLMARHYGIRGFPSSFVIDPQGNISDLEVGYTTYWGLKARLWWAGL